MSGGLGAHAKAQALRAHLARVTLVTNEYKEGLLNAGILHTTNSYIKVTPTEFLVSLYIGGDKEFDLSIDEDMEQSKGNPDNFIAKAVVEKIEEIGVSQI